MAQLIGKTEDDKDIYGVDFDIEVKECKQTEDGKRVVSMIGSTPSIDRDGDTIRQSGWDLGAFKKNPVILFGHNHDIPAIGRANKFKKSKEALVFEEIEFPKEGVHKFADMIYSLMEAKFIKAGSVGFIPLEMQRRKVEEDEPDIFFIPTDFKKQELIEFSIVNVGSNRDALVTHLGNKGFKTTGKVKIGDQEFEMKQLIEAIFSEEKTVIPFKHYPLADEDTPWNGPREIREADVDQLRKMSTWFDSEDSDVKNSYKLPHHQASDLKTVWNGVRAGMGALFGARTPLDVPDGDRRGIYNHLKSHYLEFDKPVPDFKVYSEAELKETFPEVFEEKDITEVPEDAETITKELKEKDGTFEAAGKSGDCGTEVIARYCVVIDEKETLVDVPLEMVDATHWKYDESKAPKGWKSVQVIAAVTDSEPTVNINILSEEKAGAVLSRSNKNKLKDAAQAINDVLAAAEPAVTDGEHSNDDKPKSPEEVILKQVLKKLAEMEAARFQTKEKPADDEIDLDTIKVPVSDPMKQEVDLNSLKLSEKKEDIEIDKETLTELINRLQQEIKETVRLELNKVTGKID